MLLCTATKSRLDLHNTQLSTMTRSKSVARRGTENEREQETVKQIKAMIASLDDDDADLEVFKLLRENKRLKGTFPAVMVCDYYRRISTIANPDVHFRNWRVSESSSRFRSYMRRFQQVGTEKKLLPKWWRQENCRECEDHFVATLLEDYAQYITRAGKKQKQRAMENARKIGGAGAAL
jgi:hypothetical protein